MRGKRWVAAATVALAGWAAPAASAETIFGITDDNHLVTFDSEPTTILGDRAVTGLNGGNERIVAIDVRPATLQLYGLSSADRLYRINVSTGAATAIGEPLDLGGNDVGIDFNPAVDRLRVVTDTGQNLRVNPADGTVVTDAPLTGDPTVASAAYTNNGPPSSTYPDPPTTRLYDIDTAADALLEQTPPNDGTLVNVGPLGVDVGGPVGFDVSTTDKPSTGQPETNTAYAAMRPVSDNKTRLYVVDLGTGAATARGESPGEGDVRDIAVAPPVPSFALLLENLVGQSLAVMRADQPGRVRTVGAISGLALGERLVGFDRRLSDNGLYAVSDRDRVYQIDPATGAATVVGDAIDPALEGTHFGVDVDPVSDRLRVISDTDQNLTVNPTTGATTAGKPVSYGGEVPAPDPQVTAIAFANATLFGIDTGRDATVREENAGLGTLAVVGELGVDPSGVNGYEIVRRFNHGFAVLETGNNRGLYAINASASPGQPANGTAVRVGTVQGTVTGAPIGLAVLNETTPIPEPEPTPSPTPTPTATPDDRPRPKLSASVRPRRDRSKPFRFRVKGRVQPPEGIDRAAACKGRIRITAKRKQRRFARVFARVGDRCTFARRVKLRKAGRRGRARFAVRFGGNAVLKPRTVARTVRYGVPRG